MSAWISVAAVVVAQAALQLIAAAAYAWRERVHARSNCSQIKAAAEARAILQDQRRDQSTLIIPDRSGPHRAD
jgi:Flp pilus assembly protein TadB